MVLFRKPALLIGVSGNIASTKTSLVKAAVSDLYRHHFLELLDELPHIPKKIHAESEPFHKDLLSLT